MKRILFLSAFCLLLSACGGGSDGTTTSSTSTATTPSTTSTTTTDATVSKEITGTASEGAALAGKAYLKDAKGAEVSADIATDGKFKFVVDGLTTPYLLRAGNLYSFAPAHGTANINPFTDLATKIALNVTDLATVYSNSTGSIATQLKTVQSNIQATVDDLNSKISQVYQKYGLTTTDQKNFMTGTITIGQGVDALFDTFKVTVASDGSISMKTISGGATIFTAKSSGSSTMTIVSESFSTNLPSALAGSPASGSSSATGRTSTSGNTSASGASATTNTGSITVKW
jgi:hypothetical protein